MVEVSDSVVRQVSAVLLARPAGLLTDIDGTISHIAPTPGEALVTLACRRHLSALCRRVSLVAAVSGRSADDAREMVGVPDMVYVGNHGLEVWRAGEVEVLPEARPFVPLVAAALADVAAATAGWPGILYENKGVTASVHYRLAVDPNAAREAILAALERSAAARGLRVTEGRMVVELRPPLVAHKGTAVRALLGSHGLRGAVYLVDDTTDIDAFVALRQWAADGQGRSLAVAVAAAETPSALLEQADITLLGVTEVEALLSSLVAVLPVLQRASRRTGDTTT
jgi:trehalose 6-phosphate phosphatase